MFKIAHREDGGGGDGTPQSYSSTPQITLRRTVPWTEAPEILQIHAGNTPDLLSAAPVRGQMPQEYSVRGQMPQEYSKITRPILPGALWG